jgi:hypothetical protein
MARYHIRGNTEKLDCVKSQWKSGYYGLLEKTEFPLSNKGKDYYFLRSHCALFRMDLLREHGLTFSHGEETACKGMCHALEKLGYELVFLPARLLSQYMVHLNHATMILNPELGSKKRNLITGRRHIKNVLKSLDCDRIFEDESLDVH